MILPVISCASKSVEHLCHKGLRLSSFFPYGVAGVLISFFSYPLERGGDFYQKILPGNKQEESRKKGV